MSNQIRLNVNARIVKFDAGTEQFHMFRIDRQDEPLRSFEPSEFGNYLASLHGSTWYIRSQDEGFLAITRELWVSEDHFVTYQRFATYTDIQRRIAQVLDFNDERLGDDILDSYELSNLANTIYMGFDAVLQIISAKDTSEAVSIANHHLPQHIALPLVRLIRA